MATNVSVVCAETPPALAVTNEPPAAVEFNVMVATPSEFVTAVAELTVPRVAENVIVCPLTGEPPFREVTVIVAGDPMFTLAAEARIEKFVLITVNDACAVVPSALSVNVSTPAMAAVTVKAALPSISVVTAVGAV